MICETIESLSPNTKLVVKCDCGFEVRKFASLFKEANLGFLRLDEIHKVMACERYRCDGKVRVEDTLH